MPVSDKSNKQSPDYDRAYDPDVADADLTDLEYLRRQSARAKAAIMGAATAAKSTASDGAHDVALRLKDVTGSVGGGIGGGGGGDGPLHVVRDHPWYSVGTATAVGFAGAWLLKPTRKRKIHRRLRDLEKRLEEQEEARGSGGGGGDSTTKAAKSSIWASLGTLVVTHGMQALKPLMTDVIAPMMAGRMQPGQDPGDPMAGGPMPGMHPGMHPGMNPGAMHPGAMPPGMYPGAMYGGVEGGEIPPEVEAAIRAHYGNQPPPKSAGDPSI